MDERVIKVSVPHEDRSDGLPNYPYNFLPHTPPRPCVCDSFHGTIGVDIFPFAVTTRIVASSQVFLKVYEDMDHPDEGQGP